MNLESLFVAFVVLGFSGAAFVILTFIFSHPRMIGIVPVQPTDYSPVARIILILGALFMVLSLIAMAIIKTVL